MYPQVDDKLPSSIIDLNRYALTVKKLHDFCETKKKKEARGSPVRWPDRLGAEMI